MRAHEVYVKELNKSFPVLALNIFDAAIFVLGEQQPSWIRAVCRVKSLDDNEQFLFRATKHGDEVVFEYGE